MKQSPFGSELVITEAISEETLSTYLVGFDINDDNENEYRWKNFVDVIMRALCEFAFGLHEGDSTPNSQIYDKMREAAHSIYKINEFREVKSMYENDEYIDDDDDSLETKYLRRGEFGELILHLLLRDFHNTIPLLSKIYFKDSYGHAVHGFDAVHIHPESRSLWLGESKIYIDGKKGVKALVQDIFDHIKRDYLNSEFTLISKKIKLFENIDEKEHWLSLIDQCNKLSDQLKSITLPLLCVYTSDVFSKYEQDTLIEFKQEYEAEVRKLYEYFEKENTHKLKNKLNIILLLFPVKCKKELVKRLHDKLTLLQKL